MVPPSAPPESSWHANSRARNWVCAPPPAGVREFHARLPGYRPTPLISAPSIAEDLNVAAVFVKDESTRLDLPSFKGLGVSYAMNQVIRERAIHKGANHDHHIHEHQEEAAPSLSWERLREAAAKILPLDFVAATEGNHGRAVARFARLLGARATIYLPDTVNLAAIRAIETEGAAVRVLAEDYDETVRAAAHDADQRPEAVLIQDTSWPGYEQIPQWIVEGYSTLFVELDEQLATAARSNSPANRIVVAPMGVGSLAQAVVAHYRSREDSHQVALLGVEPATAAGIQASLRAGYLKSVPTSSTIMDGLNCGTPSALAWPYLTDGLDAAVSISDAHASAGIDALRTLGVSAGPCGTATLAAARKAASDPDLRRSLGITPETTIVLLSTEGNHEDTPSPSATLDPATPDPAATHPGETNRG